MNTFQVGIIGCTGMVGQRFVSLLSRHPWFTIAALAAGRKSAGMTYAEAVAGRWRLDEPIPGPISSLIVRDAVGDAARIAPSCDFVFCAVEMPKNETRLLEEAYARLECPVISVNSAHRQSADVPMIIPELNPHHAEIIPVQRARLGTKIGFIAALPSCSIQSYVPALHPLRPLRPTRVAISTYQAVPGAGGLIPDIEGEERKSELEPLKIWGTLEPGGILPAESPLISAQCIGAPTEGGHLAAVLANFDAFTDLDDVRERMLSYRGEVQALGLPTAPRQLIHLFDQPDRPQPALDRNRENGMAVSVGRLRADSVFQLRFVSLSHNTLRGAAGGAVLLAELLCAKGYLSTRRSL